MGNLHVILRSTICLLSIVVLWLLGIAGEELFNLWHGQVFGGGLGVDDMPTITRLAFYSFPINSGSFALSLTPWMILMIGAAGVGCSRPHSEVFWLLFVGLWLSVIAYLLMVACAMLVPFHLLIASGDRGPVPTIVRIVNTVIVSAFLLVLAIAVRKAVMATRRMKHRQGRDN